MTIRKGEEWGSAVARPAGLVVARDDADLARLVAGTEPTPTRPPLAVAGGDLFRTLGGPRAPLDPDATELRRVSLDRMRCELDGRTVIGVAHVVARGAGRRGWWFGEIRGVFVAQYLGEWDVAPGGHPGDGRAEVIEVDPAMGVRQRWQAWRRLGAGTHLPHPAIRVTRRAEVEWRWPRPRRVWIDGVDRGRASRVRVTVEPDAYELHV